MKEQVKILIVDDLKENHLVMESVLTDPGLDLIKAMSGEEALALCLEHDFAVIFMDVQMPGMDGFETAELLRSIEKTKSIPIIFVTAISKEQKSIFRGYEVGAIDYLSKPIDPIVLRSKARVFKDLYNQRRIIEHQLLEMENQLLELQRIQQEKEVFEHLSLIDSLTQIYNRRGIDKMFKMHWNNCVRYQLSISALMIDNDCFKLYNDNYGHLKGDEVLRRVAQICKDSLYRSEDFIGRYGGEEYLVIMPNVDLEGAKIVAERILQVVRESSIAHGFSTVDEVMTVSIGVASLTPSADMESQLLIHEADKNLYIAKEMGRNRYFYS